MRIMLSKRKRATISTIYKDSGKGDDHDSNKEFTIKGILDHRRGRRGLEYLVDWEDDPDTGRSWEPTWEKEDDVNEPDAKAYNEKNNIEKPHKKPRLLSRSNSSQHTPRPSIAHQIRDSQRRAPRIRRVIESSSYSPLSSPATREIGDTSKARVQVVETPARPHTISLQVEIPKFSTQEKEEYSTIPNNPRSSGPTQSSYDHKDSGFESLSPLGIQDGSGQVGVTTVVSDSQQSQQQSASYGAATSSKSLALIDLTHEGQTTTTGSVEDSDSLFIPLSRPLPVDEDLSEEYFIDRVNAAQQSQLHDLLPSPEPEIDLDDLSPIQRVAERRSDLLTNQSEAGLAAGQSSVLEQRISSAEQSSPALQNNPPPPTQSSFVPVPLGQFSQEFSSCSQEFATQFSPHHSSRRDDLQDAQPQPVHFRPTTGIPNEIQALEPADQDQASTSLLGELEIGILGDQDSRVTPKPDFEIEEDVYYTPSIARDSIEDIRTLLSEEAPRTPEAQTMENRIPSAGAFSQTTPGSRGPSLREKLNTLRENIRGNSGYPLNTASAEPSGSATPSGPPTAILDKPADEPISMDGPPSLSQRVVSSSPPTFVRPSDLGGIIDEDMTMASPTTRDPELGVEEYAISVPLEGVARNSYLELLRDYTPIFHSLIDFSPDDHPSRVDEVVVKTEKIFLNLHRILAHEDLNNQGTAIQVPVSPENDAAWSENISQKFYFLRLFLNLAQHLPKRVCIIAENGRILDILERFFRGRNIMYTRPNTPHFSPWRSEALINIDLLSMLDLDRSVTSKPDLIIAFDITFDAKNPGIKRLRGENPDNRTGKIVPVVHLLTPYSVEHIERCLPSRLQGLKRQQAVARAALQLAPTIRYMRSNEQDNEDDEDGPLPIGIMAISLAEFLEGRGDLGTAHMEPLDLNLGSDESSSANELAPHTHLHQESRPLTPVGSKRTLSGDFENPVTLNTSKRQRLTPLGDITHVSDSVQGSQLERALREAQQALVETKREHVKQSYRMQVALNAANKQIQEHVEEIDSLKISLATKETRLHTFESEIGKVQYRVESKAIELLKVCQELAASAELIKSAEIKRDRTIKENTALKEERLQLQSDLQAARDLLKAGGGTSADLELLREDMRTLFKDKTNLEKRVESVQMTHEYTQKAYQEASIAATSNANQVTDLEKQNEDLGRRAESKAAEFRRVTLGAEFDRRLARIMELETSLASRDELLRRKEEELRELRRNRGMGTRASSVQPRSPRLGHSRPVSPAPGNLVPVLVPGVRGGSALRFGLGHETR